MHEMLVYKQINSVNLYCVEKACTICSYLLMQTKTSDFAILYEFAVEQVNGC